MQRFLLTPLPLIFLLAGLASAAIAHATPTTGRMRTLLGAALSTAVLAWILIATRPPSELRLANGYRFNSADPGLAALLEDLKETVASEGRIGLIGTFDELSPALVTWSLHQRPVDASFQVVRSLPTILAASDDTLVEARVDNWLERRRPDQIVTFILGPRGRWAGQDYQQHNAWQSQAIAVLEGSPAWQAGERAAHRSLRLKERERARHDRSTSEIRSRHGGRGSLPPPRRAFRALRRRSEQRAFRTGCVFPLLPLCERPQRVLWEASRR